MLGLTMPSTDAEILQLPFVRCLVVKDVISYLTKFFALSIFEKFLRGRRSSRRRSIAHLREEAPAAPSGQSHQNMKILPHG